MSTTWCYLKVWSETAQCRGSSPQQTSMPRTHKANIITTVPLTFYLWLNWSYLWREISRTWVPCSGCWFSHPSLLTRFSGGLLALFSGSAMLHVTSQYKTSHPGGDYKSQNTRVYPKSSQIRQEEKSCPLLGDYINAWVDDPRFYMLKIIVLENRSLKTIT